MYVRVFRRHLFIEAGTTCEIATVIQEMAQRKQKRKDDRNHDTTVEKHHTYVKLIPKVDLSA